MANRPTRSAPPTEPPPKVNFGTLITNTGRSVPSRYILYAGEGWGKTSFGAQFPRPIFIETRGETGLETLIDARQLPEIPHFPETMSWLELLEQVDWLRTADHSFGTLIVDTANGAERLLHEHVCHRDYDDKWGEKGFGAYQKGFEVSIADLTPLLAALDSLRIERRMTIVILGHRRITTVKNPVGADYDAFIADLNKFTWGAISKWADCILYGDWEVQVGQVNENKKTGARKGKALEESRIIRTESSAAWIAKNRMGLPAEIEADPSPEEAFKNFADALREARQRGRTAAQEGVDA